MAFAKMQKRIRSGVFSVCFKLGLKLESYEKITEFHFCPTTHFCLSCRLPGIEPGIGLLCDLQLAVVQIWTTPLAFQMTTKSSTSVISSFSINRLSSLEQCSQQLQELRVQSKSTKICFLQSCQEPSVSLVTGLLNESYYYWLKPISRFDNLWLKTLLTGNGWLSTSRFWSISWQ